MTTRITMGRLLRRLARDERGGEVLEYALVAGMISVIAVAPMTSVGQKIVSYWRSLDAALGL